VYKAYFSPGQIKKKTRRKKITPIGNDKFPRGYDKNKLALRYITVPMCSFIRSTCDVGLNLYSAILLSKNWRIKPLMRKAIGAIWVTI
jgi:hypothetical protein